MKNPKRGKNGKFVKKNVTPEEQDNHKVVKTERRTGGQPKVNVEIVKFENSGLYEKMKRVIFNQEKTINNLKMLHAEEVKAIENKWAVRFESFNDEVKSIEKRIKECDVDIVELRRTRTAMAVSSVLHGFLFGISVSALYYVFFVAQR